MKDRKRILFLSPPVSFSERYGVLWQAGDVQPPLGLAYLAAITRKIGLDTTILDAGVLDWDVKRCVEEIINRAPDFLGITIATMTVMSSSKLAQEVKKHVPHIKVIVGGCHVTALPVRTLQENPSFDFGIIGEGEKTLEELIKALIEEGNLSLVKGIVFRSDGEVVLTSRRERISNLDELPMPAFDLLPSITQHYHTMSQCIKYSNTISLVPSRGCMGRCAFCDRNTFGNIISTHSAGYIVEMMAKLKKDFGIRGIIFEDDNFMLSYPLLSELADLLNKRNLRMPWSALSRIDTITEEKLKVAKTCGCWQIVYGIESGSQKILDLYKKGISIDQIKEAIILTKRQGFYTKGLFMWGNPLETDETIHQTQQLIYSLPLDDISIAFFTPFPGSDLWNDINSFGHFDNNWNKLTCYDLVFIPHGMSGTKLTDTQTKTLKKFYKRPRVLWSYFTRLRSFSQFRRLYNSWRALSKYTKTFQSDGKLLLIADDFGLDSRVNKGVERAFRQGVLTGASLLVNGNSVDDAVLRARRNPSWNIGLHINLTEGQALLPYSEIPSLVNKEGIFKWKIKGLFFAVFFGKVKIDEIKKEIEAQFKKYVDTGLSLTHINGHHQVHVIPKILPIIVSLMKKYKVPYMRYPYEPLCLEYVYGIRHFWRMIDQILFNLICKHSKKVLIENNLNNHYSFRGLFYSGRLNKNKLLSMIDSSSNKPIEIMCHISEEAILPKKGGEEAFNNIYCSPEELSALLDSEVCGEIQKRLVRKFR